MLDHEDEALHEIESKDWEGQFNLLSCGTFNWDELKVLTIHTIGLETNSSILSHNLIGRALVHVQHPARTPLLYAISRAQTTNAGFQHESEA